MRKSVLTPMMLILAALTLPTVAGAQQLKPFTVDQLRDSFVHAQMILSGPRGESQADKMEALESAACASLGLPDPYAG